MIGDTNTVQNRLAEAEMTRITLDAASQNVLHALTEPAELCDDEGRVIGRFLPRMDPTQFTPLEPQVNDDALSLRERSTDWHSTSEVLDSLRSKRCR
jgi:hypothetical protein